MQSYIGITGSTYNLAGQLGGGGEGTVFAIQGSNDKVAKLYKPEKIYDNNYMQTSVSVNEKKSERACRF